MNPDHKIADESLIAQLRALPHVVWILFAGLFIHRFGTFVVPFLTLYLTSLGYSAKQIALIFFSMSIGGIGSMAMGGRLSDLIGRKNTMAIALISGACSMLLMWQAHSQIEYLVTAFFVGLTHGMYHPASNSLLADVVPPQRRVTAYAVIRWGVNLGFACGMAAGGFLAERNFSWLFIGDASTSAIFGIIALLTLPHGLKTSAHRSRWKHAVRHMISNRQFVGFFIANFLVVGIFFQWGSSVARLIIDLGYTKQTYGWVMAASGLIITFFEIPISQISRRLPAHRVIALGFFLCGMGLWLNAFAATWMVIALAMIVFTMGEMISMPVSGAYIAEMAPDEMRGRYSAAVGLTWNLGNALAPGLGLIIYEFHPQILWWGLLASGILSGGVMLLSRHQKFERKDTPIRNTQVE